MRTPIGVALSALVALAAMQAFASRETAPLAATKPIVQRMQINSLAQSKTAMLAGGELGQLAYSRDAGKTWTPAAIDQNRQASINQISFSADGLTGMAVGHEGWILRSTDGGLAWKEVNFQQRNGEPLMSIARMPSGEWIAVGAFGRAIKSNADGSSWQALELPPSVEDKHLNRIAGSADGRQWMIVGERGLVLISNDGGTSWRDLPPFYNGSFYNVASLLNGGWLVYGMRGNAFRSSDGGNSWTKAQIPAPVSFFAHSQDAQGHITLAGQGGMLALSTDEGQSFTLRRAGMRANLTDLLVQGKDQTWIASSTGLHPLPPAPAAAVKVANAGASQ